MQLIDYSLIIVSIPYFHLTKGTAARSIAQLSPRINQLPD